MPSGRARELKRLEIRVAVHPGNRWMLHPAKFTSRAVARTFGAGLEPRGYAVEVSRTGWPSAVLYCNPDLAVEIVADLIKPEVSS